MRGGEVQVAHAARSAHQRRPLSTSVSTRSLDCASGRYSCTTANCSGKNHARLRGHRRRLHALARVQGSQLIVQGRGKDRAQHDEAVPDRRSSHSPVLEASDPLPDVLGQDHSSASGRTRPLLRFGCRLSLAVDGRAVAAGAGPAGPARPGTGRADRAGGNEQHAKCVS
jgi:hypothetical protein